MIADRIQQSYSSSKYYQFYTVATILEHVIDCLHTIVSDETNPYHPPLSWLTRKQPRKPGDELFADLFAECSTSRQSADGQLFEFQLSQSVKVRLEKYSLEERRAISLRTKEGCAPLFMACKSGYLEVTKYLLETCGAEIEQKGRFETSEDHHVHSVSPIWVAAVSGHLDVVKLLIDCGANVNSLSDTGSTPLRSVCFLCKDNQIDSQEEDSSSDICFEIVKLLVERGADVSRPNYSGGSCLINSIHNYSLAQYIIDHGADINASDHQSKTALHYAVQQGRLDITKLLLSKGANPMLRASFADDALQLSCLGGHVDIFEHLIQTIPYSARRLADAYKLLGSSVLELQCDLSRVRELWLKSLETSDGTAKFDHLDNRTCDIRRSAAFGDTMEFSSEQELFLLSADDFRLHSLLISERVLGLNHRETIQRLLYRGAFYINCLRPDRCIDLWIYALELRLRFESIFHSESITAAQAITRFFLDLLNQSQDQVKFRDVYDVLALMVDQLDTCRLHLNHRPVFRQHEDIFDLLLGTIVNLLAVIDCVAVEPEEVQATRVLVRKLTRISPRTSNGSSLLHVSIDNDVLYTEPYSLMARRIGVSPVVKLIDTLIDNGLEPDLINHCGLSALQVVCLTNCRAPDKKRVIKRLIGSGCHVDRRAPTLGQNEAIRQALREAGVNLVQHQTLACLAARRLRELSIELDKTFLAKSLLDSVAIH